MPEHVLEARNIYKQFPGTLALNDVSVSFQAGAVHAVLGKNGSGKSTLMKIFSGAYLPTKGEIYLDGEKMNYTNTEMAIQSGIATVYQELSVIKDLTVAENLLIGRLPMKSRFAIDWKKVDQLAQETLDYLNVQIPLNAYVRDLTVGQQQLIEIAKALSAKPRVLILDEPTSALSDAECEKLFTVMQDLKKKGLIILFITHRLQEVFKAADTVTVLRDSLLIGCERVKDIDSTKLINMMFGEVNHHVPHENHATQKVVLSARNLRSEKLRDVSFELHEGEILGIAGMLGSGRTELLRAVYGLDPLTSGQVFLDGEAVRKLTPVHMKKKGLGFTSENRKDEGLCVRLSVADNLLLANYYNISPKGYVDSKMEKDFVNRQIEGLSIKVADVNAPASSLSGGNQQKLVVGNWLNTQPRILLMDEPSRGIDVSAKQQVFNVMWREAEKGVSSIMVSSELEELLEVCDRILIMRSGRICGEYMAAELNVESIYSLCMQEDEKA